MKTPAPTKDLQREALTYITTEGTYEGTVDAWDGQRGYGRE